MTLLGIVWNLSCIVPSLMMSGLWPAYQREWEVLALGTLNITALQLMSSQAACHELCLKLDKNYVWNPQSESSAIFTALSDFNTRVSPEDQIHSFGETSPRQQSLSQAIDSCTIGNIKSRKANNTHFQAHINHTTASGAGSWLHAVLAKALGTADMVDPLVFHIYLLTSKAAWQSTA